MSISDKRIYLASRSPRRRDLLKQVGVLFELLLLRETGVLPRSERFDDAVAALVRLGYTSTQSQEAVRQAAASGSNLSSEDLVKRSLASLGKAAALTR